MLVFLVAAARVRHNANNVQHARRGRATAPVRGVSLLNGTRLFVPIVTSRVFLVRRIRLNCAS